MGVGYTIEGYQVMKKRLSYRDKELLGHGLTQEEDPRSNRHGSPHRGIITNGASPGRELSVD